MSHARAREALPKAELDDFVRPKVEMILVSARGNTPTTLHIMSDEQWMEPVCSARAKRWIDKSTALYPRGYAPFCSECVEKHFNIEVEP